LEDYLEFESSSEHLQALVQGLSEINEKQASFSSINGINFPATPKQHTNSRRVSSEYIIRIHHGSAERSDTVLGVLSRYSVPGKTPSINESVTAAISMDYGKLTDVEVIVLEEHWYPYFCSNYLPECHTRVAHVKGGDEVRNIRSELSHYNGSSRKKLNAVPSSQSTKMRSNISRQTWCAPETQYSFHIFLERKS
jgi:hypothetical protein